MSDAKHNTIKLGFMEFSRTMDLCQTGTMLMIRNYSSADCMGHRLENVIDCKISQVSLKESSSIDLLREESVFPLQQIFFQEFLILDPELYILED